MSHVTREEADAAEMGNESRPWTPTWGPSPALSVVLNEDPATPTFPNGFPADPEDPL